MRCQKEQELAGFQRDRTGLQSKSRSDKLGAPERGIWPRRDRVRRDKPACCNQVFSQLRIPVRPRFVPITTSIHSQQLAGLARLPGTARRRTPHLSSCRQAPPVFSDHRLQHFLVQAQIRNQVLQVPVFVLQPLQLLGLVDFHPTVLRLPGVDGPFADPDLSRQLGYLAPRLVLLQNADYLLLCDPAMYCSFNSNRLFAAFRDRLTAE
jgi:hypothetical protein